MSEGRSGLDGALNSSTPFAPQNSKQVAERIAINSPAPNPVEFSGSDEDSSSPTHVFIPVKSRPESAEEGFLVEIREGNDGHPTLPVYTSVQLLEENLGASVPRVKIAIIDLLVQVPAAQVAVAVNPSVRTEPEEAER